MQLTHDERARLISALDEASRDPEYEPASRDPDLELAAHDPDRFGALARHLQDGGDLILTDPQVRRTVRDGLDHAQQEGASPDDFTTVTAAVRDVEFRERVAHVADEAVQTHAASDRPVEDVFTELAARDGIITTQGDVTGPSAEHIARLEAVAQELDRAIHALHEHDPHAVIRANTPDDVALAQRTQEIPELDPPRAGEPYMVESTPPEQEHHRALHR